MSPPSSLLSSISSFSPVNADPIRHSITSSSSSSSSSSLSLPSLSSKISCLPRKTCASFCRFSSSSCLKLGNFCSYSSCVMTENSMLASTILVSFEMGVDGSGNLCPAASIKSASELRMSGLSSSSLSFLSSPSSAVPVVVVPAAVFGGNRSSWLSLLTLEEWMAPEEEKEETAYGVVVFVSVGKDEESLDVDDTAGTYPSMDVYALSSS
mmetsp:Transcript_24538/g.45784  ORF Transcript_24538/g.45784 Transcript_24538/m.45784 type:complete len:210 (-) Transcript_24538:87-716(-)